MTHSGGASVIDTHAHVFHRGLPLADGRRYTPTYDAHVTDYLQQLDRQNIDRGVLVQPSFLGTDNTFLLDSLAVQPERLRGVVVIDPSERNDLDAMDALGVRGVRLNLLGEEVPDLTVPVWNRLESWMASHNWHLEIQARASQWEDLAETLADWQSDVVVDHLGLPDEDDRAARSIVTKLVDRPHIWVKVSAPYRSSAPCDALSEMLDVVGPDRMLFGTDWPFTAHESHRQMGDLVDWVRTRVGDDVFAETMPRNARRLFRWN
ncbi:MAG: amidohydrolase family protein [Rhodococcus sp. (in: high G+C Gram-positive bacteria)]